MILAEGTPDFLLFFGRFHPLVVHLPIGFLLLAGLMEIASRKPKYAALKPAVAFSLMLGAIGAILACMLGYLLSLEGGYSEDALSQHQWMGIVLAVISAVAWLAADGTIKIPEKAYMVNLGVMALLLMITGHLGGNLTHGSSYLTQYLPKSVKDIAGIESYERKERRKISNLDSALVFEDVVLPLLDARCVSCHNPEKIKGGLLMTSHANLLKGGDSGSTIVPGKANDSELYKRVTLPHASDEFMPPEGKTPLTDEQVSILHWWISNGAEKDMLLANYELEEGTRKNFAMELGLDAKKNALPEISEMADPQAVASIREQGFYVMQIAMEQPYLEVKPSPGKKLDSSKLSDVLKIKDQVIWLNLANSGLKDENLEIIGQLPNLVRLRIENNPISGEGLQYLSRMQYLEYLNMYGTEVGDEQLKFLEAVPKLKRLYLWQTKVTEAGIDALKSKKPDLEIIMGSGSAGQAKVSES